MRYTLEQLQEMAKAYIKSGVRKMYATSDGNFFYEESKAYAEAHSNKTKTELHLISLAGEVKTEKATEVKEEKPKRVRRTKAEIDAANKDAETDKI